MNDLKRNLTPESESDPLADDRLHADPSHAAAHATGYDRKAFLTLAALGVVYGDIGTSPLYAVRETVLAAIGHVSSRMAVMGGISLIFWSLMIVVTLKYVVLIMRADNEGEGGVLALASLAHRSPGLSRGVKSAIGFAAIIGLALFFGDGMLTPAISVLSAVEGLNVSASAETLVMPVALAILIGLFFFQSRGTARVGRLFGPIMVAWFTTIAVLGLRAIIKAPDILFALNPYYGIDLFIREPWTAFYALGSVVLAVTGCEALYADMGHFGKFPIRVAWLVIVLPALTLNYLGQGALLLTDPSLAHVVFFALAPQALHLPMVLLATVATVIASQAVISGVFSITRQAVQLGQLPRMEIRHTSATEFGQIFVPRVNVFLCIGVVLIILIFKTSDALAAAYGIAVTGVMVISTCYAAIVAAIQWRWGLRLSLLVFGSLALIDLAFLSSNILFKFSQGGWLPLAIAAAVYILMETWRLGRRAHQERIRTESLPLDLFLDRADKTPVRVSGTAVFLTARGDAVPGALLHNLKHNKVLHERVLLTNVVVEETPFVSPEKRIEVKKLGKGFFSVKIHHGFFETPDVPRALREARPFGLLVDLDTSTFFVGRETLVPGENPVLGSWRTWLYTQLAQNALSPAKFYHLPPNRVVELGTQVTI